MKPRGLLIEKTEARPTTSILEDFFDRMDRCVTPRMGAGKPIASALDPARWTAELAGELLERPRLAREIVDRIVTRTAHVRTIEEFRDHLEVLRQQSVRLAYVIDEAEPDPRPHVLYRLFSESGVLLYIGITDRGPRRWVEHARSKTWFGSVARFEIERFDSRPDLEAAEVLAIRSERPLYNVVHNRG